MAQLAFPPMEPTAPRSAPRVPLAWFEAGGQGYRRLSEQRPWGRSFAAAAFAWTLRRATRSARNSRLTRRAGEEVKVQSKEAEALEYLDGQESQELAVSGEAQVMTVKKGKVRHKDLVDPALPEGVAPYAPGEGYGSNAIPFVGEAPKTSKRRNPGNRMKAIKMLEDAKEIAERKKEERAVRKMRLPSQQLPVPESVFTELEEKGWLEQLAAEGLRLEVQETEPEWVRLQISGEEEKVRAGVLRLMSLMVPPRAA
ncbi:unnamed protein product [Effrenium voratum]|nr:unnamed protein product [Effrenium voratum]CAJ1427632.1 unnamed protein product [Effrenium voratum]